MGQFNHYVCSERAGKGLAVLPHRRGRSDWLGSYDGSRVMFRFFKVGGLYHWRVGRVGGSFFVSRKRDGKVQAAAMLALMTGGPVAMGSFLQWLLGV